MKSKLLILGAAVALVEGFTRASFDTRGGARAEEIPPVEIVADQIRDQGFSCNKALTAQRDPEYSRPDEPVWILECDNAIYRVRLIPDMAAYVERLDEEAT
jgi:hypothetical protein